MSIIKARWIVPVTSPPIEEGWIRIEEGVIMEMGTGSVGARLSRPGGETPPLHDFGESALFPGLINTHCHLEFGRDDHPRNSFAGWVRSVQAAQARQTDADRKQLWADNAHHLLKTGTTAVVNHCSKIPLSPPLLKGEVSVSPLIKDHNEVPPFHKGGLGGISQSPHIIHVCEIVGSSPKCGAKSYREACRQRLELVDVGARSSRPGGKTPPLHDAIVSPTSLYAVSPVVWEQFLAQQDRVGAQHAVPLLSIHLKESEEEEHLYRKGSGALAQLVKERGGMMWCSDPIKWLQEKELLQQRTLLIHCNYLNEDDGAALQGTETSVIHCPGSHRYFGHQRFPLEMLREKGINVALGTDSLASNEDLSMLAEMRLLHETYPELDDEEIVAMATVNGARAIGDENNRGSLAVGKLADIIAVPLTDASPWTSLLQAEQVNMTMIQGDIVITDE